MLIFVPLLASLLSLHSIYWFFPLGFGLISLAGFFTKKPFFLDSGISLSILSFLFVYRGIMLNVLSLVIVIGMIFLYFGVWFFSRNEMALKEIIDGLGDIPRPESFGKFRKTSINEIMTSMLLGIFISLIGFSIASFSAFEIGSSVKVAMIVIFSSVAFLALYLIFSLLPSE